MATGAPDTVAQDAAPGPADRSLAPVPSTTAGLPVSALNTCALDADDPEPEQSHSADPNPDRPKPSRADPHYDELVSAPKSRRLTEGERLQFSSPAYHLAHDIGDAADFHDDVRNAGYGDIRYDTGRDIVHLWWKGPMPPKVRRLVEAGQTRNVQVKVREANYGSRFLLKRALRMHQNAAWDAAGIQLESRSPELGAAGISVAISCRGLSTNPGAGAALVRKVGERQTGVRISTVIVVPEGYGRVEPA